MTTENQISDNEDQKLISEETKVNTEEYTVSPAEKIDANAKKSDAEEIIIKPENNTENVDELPTEIKPKKSKKVVEATEAVKIEEKPEETQEVSEEIIPEVLTLPEILKEMENIINKEDSGVNFRRFNHLKEEAHHIIHNESQVKKSEDDEENAKFEHTSTAKLNQLIASYKVKQDDYHKKSEAEHHHNLEHRQNIIDRLKNLYTNAEPGTNLFKSIREIKEQWGNAGQVAKSEFKNLNNNYFHHLNQFYDMLDMNKEYMEQEYTHNLEKRQQIISRAKELENEPVVQKALNELQFLHKLWKEEAEPVSEEFREKTWEEFKEISNKIHERKSELIGQLEEVQQENLVKKNKIIEELKKLSQPEKEVNHNYWQQSIKKVEELRSEFLKLGNVPKKLSSQNWNDFKENLRNFNIKKNDFYKNLKGSQHINLDEKLKLIQTAKDNMLSEDWEIVVPLFKKLQEDWKKIGHVPRSVTNKIWDEFREACNTFFNNFREKNNAVEDNWKENYKKKKALLDELKEIGNDEDSVEKIEQIKTSWNAIGKVPRENLAINTDFNKTFREKLKLNKINEYDLKEEGLSENQLTDKARKMKNQIADLEAEIVKLENNLGFFGKVSRDNPLLKDTFENIDHKKAQLESMKQSLHNIIAGE